MITGTTFNRTVNDSSVTLCGGTDLDGGASITLSGKDRTNDNGDVIIRAKDNSNVSDFVLRPNGTATWTNKNLAMQEDFIPRSGGAVISGTTLKRTTDNDILALNGGSQSFKSGGGVELYGMYEPFNPGMVRFVPAISDTFTIMDLKPNGTWIWTGQPCQTASDQRLKQQISKIDNALLDAWEDVNLVQFKYNDAVNEKGSKARLHTGYVVQQIDEACQKHDVDISEYGLYCHEEYPERTEEVTIENEDGTTSKETKVIEPAKEHYSLRYTETLVVECAYLRRENARLKERLQQHDDYFSNIEKRLQSLENS